jgi:ribulose-phosphate 3-epimerase
MDGHYVPNLTFGPDLVAQIKRATHLLLDVHLMITPVDGMIEAFAKAGATRLTIHPQATHHPYRTLQTIGDYGVLAGIALTPGTPLSLIEPLMPLADLVLFMSVNPGFGGQAFIEETPSRIRQFVTQFRPNYPRTLIAVDGGINAQTAPLVIQAGAQALVAGHYLFKDAYGAAATYAQRIQNLRGA